MQFIFHMRHGDVINFQYDGSPHELNLYPLYHTPLCRILDTDAKDLPFQGFLNIDFEVRNLSSGGEDRYFYPHANYACYYCMVASYPEKQHDSIDDTNIFVKRAYYTALFRERHNSYKINRFE